MSRGKRPSQWPAAIFGRRGFGRYPQYETQSYVINHHENNRRRSLDDKFSVSRQRWRSVRGGYHPSEVEVTRLAVGCRLTSGRQ